MTIHVPVPPQLEQFVRQQLTTGRFKSESDVVQAALHLLEQQALPEDLESRPTISRIRSGIKATPFQEAAKDTSGVSPTAKRSPRGILADLPSNISLAEIKQARSTLWAGFSGDHTS